MKKKKHPKHVKPELDINKPGLDEINFKVVGKQTKFKPDQYEKGMKGPLADNPDTRKTPSGQNKHFEISKPIDIPITEKEVKGPLADNPDTKKTPSGQNKHLEISEPIANHNAETGSENVIAGKGGRITNSRPALDAKSVKNRKKPQENELKMIFERIKMKKKEKENSIDSNIVLENDKEMSDKCKVEKDKEIKEMKI